jgi:hypothetical protein
MATDFKQDNLGYYVEQDKDDELDYELDVWGGLLGSSDEIVTSEWSADAGITLYGGDVFNGKTVIWVKGGQPNTWYAINNQVTTALGRKKTFPFRVFIKPDLAMAQLSGTTIFPNRTTAIEELRRDRLLLMGRSLPMMQDLSEDYLWEKLRAAEASVARDLGVKLQPTAFFPAEPTQAQIDALDDMPWEIDPGYTYEPDAFRTEAWGYIVTRHHPIVSVSAFRFVYPSPTSGTYDLPLDWLRIDKKYGHIQLVPGTQAFAGPFSAFVMQMLGGGRDIPYGVQLNYVAGLQDVALNWPDIVQVIKRRAALAIVEDAFVPSSGSISADGLSQSLSVQMDAYYQANDIAINGAKGGNGGLMRALHGVRLAVL